MSKGANGVGESLKRTTYKDLEQIKWLKFRDECPIRPNDEYDHTDYCSLAKDICEDMENCPLIYAYKNGF